MDWGRYVSPLSDKNVVPFNWYAFKHRFGSQLAGSIFSMFGLTKGDMVFDPFCGGGTTLIKAQMDGYNSLGLDIMPFSVYLTNALTKKYNTVRLRKALKKISHKSRREVDIPDVAILTKAFSQETLNYVFSLRDSICALQGSEREFFLLVLMSVLNSVSKAKKSGGFLRITNQRRSSTGTVKKIFVERCGKLIEENDNLQYRDSSATAVLGDAYGSKKQRIICF